MGQGDSPVCINVHFLRAWLTGPAPAGSPLPEASPTKGGRNPPLPAA